MESGTEEYAVTGGFAQITADGATVLADEALPRAEATADFLAERIATAEAARDGAEGSALDEASKRMADLEALRDAL